MPLDFPSSPTTNQVYTFGTKNWIWTGSYWKQTSTIPVASATVLGGVLVNPASTAITIDSTGLIDVEPSPFFSGTLTMNAQSTQFPVNITLTDSTHATSRRAGINIGSNTASWLIGQDSAGSGVRDFFIYGNSAVRMTIGTTGNVTIPGNVTLSGTSNSVGTISSGTWNGSTIGLSYGGTGLTSYAKGDILYASAINTLSSLSVPTTNGYVLTYNSTTGLPTWSAPTSSVLGYVGSYQTTSTATNAAITGITSLYGTTGGPTSTGNFLLGSASLPSISVGLSPANTGNVYIASGNLSTASSTGNVFTSGNVYIDVGSITNASTANKGSINIGTQNTGSYGAPSSITIGQSGVTTTIAGTLAVPTLPSTAQQLFLASPISGSGTPTFRYISTSDFTQSSTPGIGQALIAAPVAGGWSWASFVGLSGGTQSFTSATVLSTLTSTTGDTSSLTLSTGTTSFATGTTGAIAISTAVPTGTTSGSSGTLTLSTGNASGSTAGVGGTISITAGNGSGSSGVGGSISLNAGTGVTTGLINIATTSGNVNIGRATTGTVNLYNPLLASISTIGGGGSEGGQINFARVTDGAQYWYIDTFGSTATPNFRVVENLTSRFEIVGGSGALSINSQTGSANQVLVSQGSAAAPVWSGALKLSSAISNTSQTALTASATITAANVLTKNIYLSVATTAVTFTLDTGTNFDTGFGTPAIGSTIEWFVMNEGTSAATITMAGGTGHTFRGTTTIAIATAAKFITRKSAANTYFTYRV